MKNMMEPIEPNVVRYAYCRMISLAAGWVRCDSARIPAKHNGARRAAETGAV